MHFFSDTSLMTLECAGFVKMLPLAFATYEAGWFSNNSLYLYLGSTWFESWPGYCLS